MVTGLLFLSTINTSVATAFIASEFVKEIGAAKVSEQAEDAKVAEEAKNAKIAGETVISELVEEMSDEVLAKL